MLHGSYMNSLVGCSVATPAYLTNMFLILSLAYDIFVVFSVFLEIIFISYVVILLKLLYVFSI